MAGEDSCLAVTPLRLITHTVEFRGDAARIRQRVVVLPGTAETLVLWSLQPFEQAEQRVRQLLAVGVIKILSLGIDSTLYRRQFLAGD